MHCNESRSVAGIAATLLALSALSLFCTLAPSAAAEGSTSASNRKSGSALTTDAALIRSAATAAPAHVGATATVVAAGSDGKMRMLREGSNGFTCMPDNPVTPGPDPMCLDKAALAWADAWMGHKTPPAGKIGFVYMLAGGTDASNTDPYASKPQTGNHWVKTGPHVMLVGADQSFYDMYPKAAQPDTTVPYVMWAGTPYQHLMMPVK